MPKSKTHSQTAKAGRPRPHKEHSIMDKVKIKRVKRNKKETSAKEKILAGIGVGSTLLGGAGAVAPKASDTQFVREQTNQSGSSSGKVKETLKRIFGVQEAKAEFAYSISYSNTTVIEGGSYVSTITGINASDYVDVEVTMPDGSSAVALNWQQGPVQTQTVALGSPLGNYNITSMRVHSNIDDHNGEFTPVAGPIITLVAAQQGPVTDSVSTINIDISGAYGSGISWSGADVEVYNWVQSHPDAARGNVEVGYDANRNIVSYKIDGQIYTPAQLASAIATIGGVLYTSSLDQLSTHNKAVYFLGTVALNFEGAPAYKLPTNAAQGGTAVIFTAPTVARYVYSDPTFPPAGVNPYGFLTSAQAQAILNQVRQDHPNATLFEDPLLHSLIGGAVDWGTENRRWYSITYTDSQGSEVKLDAYDLKVITPQVATPPITESYSLTLSATSVVQGGSYVSTITGVPAGSYVDVQVSDPYGSDQAVNNWQVGPTQTQNVATDLRVGNYTITAIRVHSDPNDHSGTFTAITPVTITVTAAPVTASTTSINIDLSSTNLTWSGADPEVFAYARSHPDAVKGTVGLNKDSAGKIISFTISGNTYTAKDLSAAIATIGHNLYITPVSIPTEHTSIDEMQIKLDALSANDRSVYFLGTAALALPGAPAYKLPLNAAQGGEAIIFTAPTTAKFIYTDTRFAPAGINPYLLTTQSQADAALAAIKQFHSTATIQEYLLVNNVGGHLDWASENRRWHNISFTDSNGNAVTMDVTEILLRTDSNLTLQQDITTPTPTPSPTPSPTPTPTPTPTPSPTGQVMGTYLTLSATSLDLEVGSTGSVTASVLVDGVAGHNIFASTDSDSITLSTSPITGVITIIGVTPGTAVITVHPANLPESNTSADEFITVNVTNPGETTDSGTGNTGGDSTGGTGSGTGSGTGTGSNTGTGGSGNTTNTDSQLISQLQNQISTLQSRIDSLNAQLAARNSGSTVVVQGGDTAGLQNQINQLNSQILGLTNLLNQYQSGSRTLSQPQPTGLQMPPGYPASAESGSAQVQGTAVMGSYTVKKGDNLWNIAKKYYGDGRQWRKILEANPTCLSIPGNTKTLKIGAVLTIPSLK